ncbi:MAG: GAF domain-containing protein [Candidatus Sumerlaeaceae bacterium]
MAEVTNAGPDDILERVLLREVELARANEALRHEHFQRRRIEKIREIFAELGEKLIDAAAPRQAALAILEAADRLFGWDASFVDVYSEQDKRFHPVVRFDVKERERTEIPATSSSVSFTPLREQLFSKGPLLILRRDEPDAADEWLLSFGSAEHKSASLMFVPMSRDGRVIGVLSIQSYERDAYSSKDLDLLQVLGNYCCHGLQRGFAEKNLRLVRQKLTLLGKAVTALIWNADEYGIIMTAEGSAWQTADLNPEDLAGQSLSDIFQNCTAVLVAHRAAMAGAETECELVWNGRRLHCRFEPVRDDADRVVCCLAIAVPAIAAA